MRLLTILLTFSLLPMLSCKKRSSRLSNDSDNLYEQIAADVQALIDPSGPKARGIADLFEYIADPESSVVVDIAGDR